MDPPIQEDNPNFFFYRQSNNFDNGGTRSPPRATNAMSSIHNIQRNARGHVYLSGEASVGSFASSFVGGRCRSQQEPSGIMMDGTNNNGNNDAPASALDRHLSRNNTNTNNCRHAPGSSVYPSRDDANHSTMTSPLNQSQHLMMHHNYQQTSATLNNRNNHVKFSNQTLFNSTKTRQQGTTTIPWRDRSISSNGSVTSNASFTTIAINTICSQDDDRSRSSIDSVRQSSSSITLSEVPKVLHRKVRAYIQRNLVLIAGISAFMCIAHYYSTNYNLRGYLVVGNDTSQLRELIDHDMQQPAPGIMEGVHPVLQAPQNVNDKDGGSSSGHISLNDAKGIILGGGADEPLTLTLIGHVDGKELQQQQQQPDTVDWSKVPPHLRGYYSKQQEELERNNPRKVKAAAEQQRRKQVQRQAQLAVEAAKKQAEEAATAKQAQLQQVRQQRQLAERMKASTATTQGRAVEDVAQQRATTAAISDVRMARIASYGYYQPPHLNINDKENPAE